MPIRRCRPGGAGAEPEGKDDPMQITVKQMPSKYESTYISQLGARSDMAHVQILHDLYACARVAAPSASDAQITNWMAYDLPPKLIEVVRTKVRTLNLVANRRMTPAMLRVGVLDRLAVLVNFEKTEERGAATLLLDQRDAKAFGKSASRVLEEEAYGPAGPRKDHFVHTISTIRASDRDRAALNRMAKPIIDFYATRTGGVETRIFELAPVVARMRADVTRGVPESGIYDASREPAGMRDLLSASARTAGARGRKVPRGRKAWTRPTGGGGGGSHVTE